MARLYIVEDEAIVCSYIESFLKKHHDVVGKGSDFVTAYEEICRLTPDLVISDILLFDKNGDGITLAQEVNKKTWTPFIFLTSMPFPKNDNRLSLFPLYGYVSKPIDEQRLLSAVEVALWRIHAEKQLDVFVSRLQREIEERKELEKQLRLTLYQHQQFIEQLIDVVFDIDAQGRIIFINRAVEDFLGYTVGEMIGKSILDFVSEDFLFFSKELLHLFQEDVINQTIFENRIYEFSFRHKKGNIQWGRVVVGPISTPSGILVGARGIIHDITREKRQQERLEKHVKELQQGKTYQAIIRYILERINQVLDPFPLFPMLVTFLHSSLGIDGILLFRATQENSKTLFKKIFCVCDDSELCQEFSYVEWDKPIEMKKFLYFWKRNQIPPSFVSYWDKKKIKRLGVFPLVFQEDFFGILVCFWQKQVYLEHSLLGALQILAHIFAQAIRRHDEWEMYTLTQKQMMEQKLLTEKAENMLAFGQMMISITHEIRQPLQSIRILSESPLYWNKEGKSVSYAKLLENMEKISQRVKRIDNIIESMRQTALSVSTIKPEDVSLHAAIEEVLDILYPEIVKAEITLEKALSTSDIKVTFHFSQLVQVISNLLTNALRVLREQSLPRIIEIETGVMDEHSFLRVIDNGPGIPPEKEKYIFEPFFTTQPGVGMGIGLYVVKKLLSLYNATIGYRRENEKTVFEIMFSQPREKTVKKSFS